MVETWVKVSGPVSYEHPKDIYKNLRKASAFLRRGRYTIYRIQNVDLFSSLLKHQCFTVNLAVRNRTHPAVEPSPRGLPFHRIASRSKSPCRKNLSFCSRHQMFHPWQKRWEGDFLKRIYTFLEGCAILICGEKVCNFHGKYPES